ncbi:MAG: hypothetical protein HW391_520, partial [Chloroflexi bacterium]|nr:hypothetical protein [Chloroflexota bacterium]
MEEDRQGACDRPPGSAAEAPAHERGDREVGERGRQLEQGNRRRIVGGQGQESGGYRPKEPPQPGQDGRERDRLVVGAAQALAADGSGPAEEVRRVSGQSRQRQEDGPGRDEDGEAEGQRDPLAPPEAAPRWGAQARTVRQYRSAAPLMPPNSAVLLPCARTLA